MAETLTARALKHNPSAFLAELREAGAARTMANQYGDAAQIAFTIVELETGLDVENEWTLAVAKRFLHDTSS